MGRERAGEGRVFGTDSIPDLTSANTPTIRTVCHDVEGTELATRASGLSFRKRVFGVNLPQAPD